MICHYSHLHRVMFAHNCCFVKQDIFRFTDDEGYEAVNPHHWIWKFYASVTVSFQFHDENGAPIVGAVWCVLHIRSLTELLRVGGGYIV